MREYDKHFWLEKYRARGFEPGKLFVKGDIAYVPIPKNASSYVSSLLLRNGWQVVNMFTTDISKISNFIVILRDPKERWISGMTQYLFSGLVGQGIWVEEIIKGWNNIVESLVLDNMIFDDHTEKQLYFLNQIPTYKCIFLSMKKDLHLRLVDLLEENKQSLVADQDPEDINFNQSAGTPRQEMINFLNQRLDLDGRYIKQIFDVYRDDYELIGKVKYYGD